MPVCAIHSVLCVCGIGVVAYVLIHLFMHFGILKFVALDGLFAIPVGIVVVIVVPVSIALILPVNIARFGATVVTADPIQLSAIAPIAATSRAPVAGSCHFHS